MTAYALMAVLCFAVLLAFGLGRSGGAAGLLQGPDDFMRMVQVLDWIDGQDWNDTVQRRLNPPAGVAMHWSRLADIPLAAIVVLAEPWLGRSGAVHLAALLVPPLLGGLLAVLFLWAADSLRPHRGVPLPVAMVCALPFPLLQMTPGRVDHHGLQLVLTALAIGLLIRTLGTLTPTLSQRERGQYPGDPHPNPLPEGEGAIFTLSQGERGPYSSPGGRGGHIRPLPLGEGWGEGPAPGGRWPAVALGVAGGVSLAVGIETLPFLGTATVILGLAAVRGGGPAAAALTWYGVALTATSLALLCLTLPPVAWTVIACDRLSLAHVAMTAVIPAAGAAALALARLRPGAGWLPRLATVGGGMAAGLALAAAAFPQCLGNPYAGVPHEIRFWLDRVAEAQSLGALFDGDPGLAVSVVILPLTALVAVGWQWTRASDRTDPRWPALALLVLSGAVLIGWQIRGVPYAGLVSAVGLVPLAVALNQRAARSERMPARIGLQFCIPVFCVFAMVLPPRLLPGSVGQPDALDAECDVRSVVEALTDPTGLGAGVQTLAAPIDTGPRILFLTPHKVLAAPYHRNIEGLTDNRRIFAGTEEQALAAVKARGVGAILFCEAYAFVPAYADRPAFLLDRLVAGDPPRWLVPVARSGGMGLYRVHPGVGVER